jgi:hypothetical protein
MQGGKDGGCRCQPPALVHTPPLPTFIVTQLIHSLLSYPIHHPGGDDGRLNPPCSPASLHRPTIPAC